MKTTALSLAVLALFLLLGSAVVAIDGVGLTANVSTKLALEKEAQAAKAKYRMEQLAMEKAAMEAKAKLYEDYSGSSTPDNEKMSDDVALAELLVDRIPAEKLEKLKSLDEEARKKALIQLKLTYKDVLEHKSMIEAKKTELASRLAEIEAANSDKDPTKSSLARLRLAIALCEREGVSDDSVCVDLKARLDSNKDKIRLTDAERAAIDAKLKDLRVVWVKNHYSLWLASAERLNANLDRIDAKLENLVVRAKNAEYSHTEDLDAIRTKFNRIQSVYAEKLAALKTAYAAFESDASFENALKVRAAAVELKIYGRFSVYAVNRFVYLYAHLGEKAKNDAVSVTDAEVRAIVDAIPSAEDIQAEATAEVSATTATNELTADMLMISSDAKMSDDGPTHDVMDDHSTDDSSHDAMDDHSADDSSHSGEMDDSGMDSVHDMQEAEGTA